MLRVSDDVSRQQKNDDWSRFNSILFLYINWLDDIIVLNTSCLQLPVAKKQVWLIMTKMWILLLPAFCAVYVSVLMHNITYIRKI